MPAIRPALARAALALALAVPLPALAQDTALTIPAQPGGPVSVSVSYAINETLSALDPDAVAALDAAHRAVMLKRADGECAALLATIATDCAVTAINISTQVNSYPGQPPGLYISSTVNLQITLKSASP
jgi:hypothetical protein